MNVFLKSTLSRPIQLPISDLEGDVNYLEKFKYILSESLQGKCAKEGFIKNGSIQPSKHSVGILKEDKVWFTVEFVADVAYPVKGQVLKCTVIGPNHYGLNCKLKEDDGANSCDVYIPRDHRHPNTVLTKYAPGSDIDVEVVGTRFEVNDAQITVIGSIHGNALTSSADVGEPIWSVEYVDAVTVDDVQAHPEKTFVVDTSLVKTKKELTALRKCGNVRVLDVQTFTTFYANKEIIKPFIESLHDAKTIVFPYKFADSVGASSEETYEYLRSKLGELGFQPVQTKQKGGKKGDEEDEEEEFGDY